MFKSYIKIGWRNIRKNGFHSLANVFGLAIGLAFTLLIAAYVWNELSVNKDLRNAGQQFILQTKWKDADMGSNLTTFGPLAKALFEQYPSLVKSYYRWDGIGSNVSKGDKVFREGLQVGDSTLLHMYGFKLLHGDVRTALNDPFSLIISTDRAKKYFGKTDVIGQTLTIESFLGTKHDFKITGVMEPPPENSVTRVAKNIDNGFFIPLNTLNFFGRMPLEDWRNQYTVGYLELQKGIGAKELQKPIAQLVQQHASPQVAANATPYLVPLKEYYVKKDNGLARKMLYTVSFIALFILIMAIINFINISIAKSSTRIKEIGVRKVMGGLKKQLMLQFLTESVILVFFAMLLALFIYYLGNPFLSGILGKQIPALTTFPPSFVLLPVLLIVVIGCMAGIYPALVLSTLKAVDSLKGKLKSVNENILVRKSLTGFQFLTASVVLIGAFIVTKQISFFFNKDLGFDKEFILSAQVPRDWSDAGVQRMQTVRNEFASLPQVASVAISWSIPDGNGQGGLPVYLQGKDSTQAVATEEMDTDENYINTYKISMKAGQFFTSRTDSNKVVINETASKALGFKNADEAVGKQIILPGKNAFTVLGVTQDYHFGSMQNKIPPITFIHVDLSNLYRFLSFKLKPGNIAASIEALQKKWSALLPGSAFEYKFMDDALAKLYESELQLKKAAQTASLLAIVIVMLGVIGLISLSVQKRTKEIGVRKVLGASIANIISLFLKEFLPVLLIGGLISLPISFYLMRGWLNNYAYRIDLTALPFLISIALLVFITCLVIALQIAKTAVESPVKNLRTE